MRIPRWGIGLLGVGCVGFVGCSQTGWLRPNGPADMKTVASVDGKPVSTASGEPGTGTAVREDIDDLAPPSAAGARISGRVFDEAGRAVPNARVRLAVGGSAGGQVTFATTDRSGAFTLHGLRPGRDYTLIAEYQAEDGMMSGRVRARAPETGVRLALGVRDPETGSRSPKILPTHGRAGLLSDQPADDFPVQARPRVRGAEEPQPTDGEPPADEVTTSDPPKSKRATAAKVASSGASATVRAGWMVRQPSTDPRSPRGRADADGPPSPDDHDGDVEGENPLPPALEPVGSGVTRASGRSGFTAAAGDDVRVASNQSNQRKARPRPASAPSDDGDPSAGSYGSPPRPIPDDALPSPDEEAVASPARGGRRTDDATADPAPRRVTSARRGPRPAPAARTRDDARSGDEDAPETDGPAGSTTPRKSSNRRPTWRELSISPDEVPVDEALRRSSADEDADDGESVIRAGGPPRRDPADDPGEDAMVEKARTTPEPEPMPMVDEVRPRRNRPPSAMPVAARRPSPSAEARRNESACRLDAGHRRIAELRLPGLDGKPVSLSEIDADLILLDFWGSWCRECRKSIEHHREIQEQIGGRTLQVVGIACEKGPTFEARRDAAIAAARRLGINYPLLVTGMGGDCPVQKALQVQFYPSMVLIDREGNILQFEQGATDATLGRIDRAIAKAVRDGTRRDAD